MINRVKQARLKTGEAAYIRPVRAEDVQGIREMYARSSEASLYQRYLRYTEPTLTEIEAMCRLDPKRGTVLVAVVDTPHEKIVGYAYYVIDPNFKPYIAEPAIMIEDDYQRVGLGSALGQAMFEAAREQHVFAFEATISMNNDAMMSVIRKSGVNYRQSFTDGVRDVFIPVNPEPEEPIVSEANVRQVLKFLISEPA